MSQKVRKQVYIEKRQQILLRRLARTRGVSEAELIREAIDQQASSGAPQAPDPAAWAEARRLMLAQHAQGPSPAQPRTWRREDLYEERAQRMDSGAPDTLQAATKLADEKDERIHFQSFEVEVSGEGVRHRTAYDHGTWSCDCESYKTHAQCSHTVAMKRTLGRMIPKTIKA
ncbi:MAG: hypothetical protein HZB53_06290 [Chloroflexi bacterium]|nr:hypothetical protein [Chloroflexota bacterium]